MRCFIAVDVDEDVKAAVVDLQEELAQAVNLRRGDVKWVAPEAMHLTLKFLGETPDDRIVNLCRAAERVAPRHERFNLSFRGVGHFGGQNARVLWIGIAEGQESLLALQADLESELDRAGWPREGRRFSAHLTLCRIKHPQSGRKLVEAIVPYTDFDAGSTPVDCLTVYQSELRPQGPLYTPLGHFDLGA
jgi:2'-5' RNA ligase